MTEAQQAALVFIEDRYRVGEWFGPFEALHDHLVRLGLVKDDTRGIGTGMVLANLHRAGYLARSKTNAGGYGWDYSRRAQRATPAGRAM